MKKALLAYSKTSLSFSFVTNYIMRDITFSADESAIERALEVARSEGTMLEDAFREWLDSYGSRIVGLKDRRPRAEEIDALFRSLKHVDAGRKFTRDEMNER